MNDQDGRRSRGRSLLVFWGRVSVSALLIWFVLSRQSLTGIKAAMTHPRWEMLLAAFAVYGVSALAGSL
ncbi:hypothetical protein COW53_01270, partial [bacterium CG17_big_fil_post_rev_8_21_14_2_50_64_8]